MLKMSLEIPDVLTIKLDDMVGLVFLHDLSLVKELHSIVKSGFGLGGLNGTRHDARLPR